MTEPTAFPRPVYTKHEWHIAVLLFVSYIVVHALAAHFIPASAGLYPAVAVALACLFFGGIRLWPVALLASFVAAFMGHAPLPIASAEALAVSLQAICGAYLLRKARIDPLFRRYNDMLIFMTSMALVAFIVPIFLGIWNSSQGISYVPNRYGLSYIASLTTLLIITPFILRWFAKPRFNRPLKETAETLLVFAALLLIDFALFTKGIVTVFHLPLIYFLCFPLFWIALRLRPRFVTLAILLTALFAIEGVIGGTASNALAGSLYSTEAFLIALAVIFFVIVSLEEDRRLNTNLMRSQLSTLENAVARISSESKAKNDFIAILAHELRNPLAPVVSAIDLLKLQAKEGTEEMETLEMMDNRMRVVRRLLDDLLDVSRITEGKLSLRKESVDLAAVIRRALLSTSHYVRERHQNLTTKGLQETVTVEGDPVRLEQIFSNLLTNASKYSDPGDQIMLSLEMKDGYAEIVVSDHGMGIAPEALGHIFTPFHQVGSGARTQKGLGIGLALVQNFVRLHQGTVVAESEGPGKGARFIVRLPLRSGDAAPYTGAPFSSEDGIGSPNILIAEDNDTAAWSMGRLLELRGCHVAYAYDGEEALKRATTESFDSILLGISLPDTGGYAVAQEIRKAGFAGTLIALSSHPTTTDRATAQSAGFDDFIITPASLTDLARSIPAIS